MESVYRLFLLTNCAEEKSSVPAVIYDHKAVYRLLGWKKPKLTDESVSEVKSLTFLLRNTGIKPKVIQNDHCDRIVTKPVEAIPGRRQETGGLNRPRLSRSEVPETDQTPGEVGFD